MPVSVLPADRAGTPSAEKLHNPRIGQPENLEDFDWWTMENDKKTEGGGINMTERVPVASSEHVAEIVGRQGRFTISFNNCICSSLKQ